MKFQKENVAPTFQIDSVNVTFDIKHNHKIKI